jgi:hypothetical protein
MEESSIARKKVPLVRRVAPGLQNLLEYRREWLRHDAVAGVSVAAVALPTAIAYWKRYRKTCARGVSGSALQTFEPRFAPCWNALEYRRHSETVPSSPPSSQPWMLASPAGLQKHWKRDQNRRRRVLSERALGLGCTNAPHELADGLALKGEFMRTAPAAPSWRGQNATNRSRGRVVWCAWRGVLWGRG